MRKKRVDFYSRSFQGDELDYKNNIPKVDDYLKGIQRLWGCDSIRLKVLNQVNNV